MTLKSLGGELLAGDKIVRLGYLDESGTGKIEVDPYAVVAGVGVNADLQWKSIEQYLKGIADEHFPGRDDVVFHATDIWHGSGLFSRDKFPDKWRRRMILLEICQLPKKFDMPVFWGHWDRRALLDEFPQATEKDRLTAALGLAAFQCAVSAEMYMRNVAPNEVAMLFYENNGQTRAYLKQMQNEMKHPSAAARIEVHTKFNQYLPIEHIVDTAYFAEKTDTVLLQAADAMAFALARKMKNAEDCDYLFEEIRPQMLLTLKDWDSPTSSAASPERSS